jgi:putative hydrolase of the HAD superfamily
MFRAVIFDLGGVLLSSPLPAIAGYENEAGLPAGLISRLASENGSDGLWAQLERGELDTEVFGAQFSRLARTTGHELDGLTLLDHIWGKMVIREDMLEAVRRLRLAGFRAAALTNAWMTPNRPSHIEPLRPEFDCVLESFRLGMRKPEQRIYTLACRCLAVTPKETVFLDDFGTNLKPAKAMGITTVKVADPVVAIAELEQLLGVQLHGHEF